MSSRDTIGLSERELWNRYTRYPYLLAKVATFGVCAGLVLAVLSSIQGVLAPVLASLIFAYLLDPTLDWFEARGYSRTTAIGVLLGMAGLAVVGFAVFLVPSIRLVLVRFTEGLPQLLQTVQDEVLPQLGGVFGSEAPSTFEGLAKRLTDDASAVMPDVAGQVASVAGSLWGHVAGFSSNLVNLVLVPFFAFYFLRDFDVMTAAAGELIPLPSKDWVMERVVRADAVVGAWFRGQIEVAAILGSLYAVGLGVCFGMSNIGWSAGVAVGVLGGALNFIPYVGTTVAMCLAFGLLVLDGAHIALIIGAMVVFAVVQALEGYVITPRIVGEKVGLSPLAVILSLAIGGEVLGMVGLLLALPVAGVAKAFWPDMVAAYQETEWFTGGAGE
jgi:predicted PurR-regulated permease PerM